MALPIWTFEIIKSIDFLKKWDKILDIWLWDWDASEEFLRKWLDVYATWININSYNLNTNLKKNINLKESFVTNLDYPDNFFDYVLASHIIEHEINPWLAFQEIRRVLKKSWKLIICLPPYKEKIVWWHVNTGYTIWQLMYQLILNKFNIKEWHFINYWYNICWIVKKDNKIKLPELRYDNWDIEKLSHLFPLKTKQWFNWNIKKINWHFRLPSMFLIKIKAHYKWIKYRINIILNKII